MYFDAKIWLALIQTAFYRQFCQFRITKEVNKDITMRIRMEHIWHVPCIQLISMIEECFNSSIHLAKYNYIKTSFQYLLV